MKSLIWRVILPSSPSTSSFFPSFIPLNFHLRPLQSSSPLRPFSSSSPSSSSSSTPISQGEEYRGPKPRRDLVRDWVADNDGLVRSAPIYVGTLSLLAVLLNRTFSGIAPVADASSSQSRADILALGLAVTNLLTGLVWLSIRPKNISAVVPQGVECAYINSSMPKEAVSELLWHGSHQLQRSWMLHCQSFKAYGKEGD